MKHQVKHRKYTKQINNPAEDDKRQYLRRIELNSHGQYSTANLLAIKSKKEIIASEIQIPV